MLEDIIKAQIKAQGPIDIGAYMMLALGHPQHGYYMKKDPFGAQGDFTTAPEISQMFGEVLAAWIADVWFKVGQPEKWALLECGPGRGTLMADILRTFKAIGVVLPTPYLLEISPVLKAMQQERIAGGVWIDQLDKIPADLPLIVIGNEFLDALPFKQLQKVDDIWMERVVALDQGDALCFGLRPYHGKAPNVHAADGMIFETAPARESFVREVNARAAASLFIDYGHLEAGTGDTFQALYKHEYVDVLTHIGDADLTSHVDFSVLEGRKTEQGAFLKALGIEARAEVLRAKAPVEIDAALHRLTADDQMGKLFKVIGYTNEDIQLAGF